MNKILKAVLPIAGLGTRMLPATKNLPKELLPIFDKPMIEYAIKEASEAGIEDFVFITGKDKEVLQDYLNKKYLSDNTSVPENGPTKTKIFKKNDLKPRNIIFVRQEEPLGLGHALLCAKNIIGSEPFCLILPDMLPKGEPGCLSQMLEAYNTHKGNVIGLEKIPMEDTYKYGIVKISDKKNNVCKIDNMIEKPRPENAPSDLMIMGRYILQPEIFDILENQNPGYNNEIQLTDALITLTKTQKFMGMIFDGKTYDCGDKLGYLIANIKYILDSDANNPDIRNTLLNLIQTLEG
jgi:UTP--glucose-1-phosphate uridylyltransferase